MKKKKKKKEKKEIEDRIIKYRLIRDIRTLFEEEENYYKPKSLSIFWNNKYIEYESNGDRNKSLSLEEYLNKIKPYLRDIIIDLQESNTWKIQLTIVIIFISSKDAEEEPVMHSKSNNIKFTYYSDANAVLDELFESLCSRYQDKLEK